MKKIIFAFAFFIIYFNGSSQTNEYEYTTNHHKKQVIGYFTTWDAWKSSSDGVPQQGFYNQLNIDYSQYTILNWSFLGVAKDGSLHSGDLRNKLIYQPGQVQEPGPMFWDDIYSSWDYWLLYGELEILYHLPDNLDKNPSDPLYWVYSKYGYKGDGNSGWINTKTGTKGSYPLPLPKPGGAKGLLELGHEKGVKIMASIGGWSMCKHFSEIANDPTKKARFIKDCVTLMNMGFDGIDIDWEFPGPFDGMNFTGTAADYTNFKNLVKDIRIAIGPNKLITAAFNSSPEKLSDFNWGELNQYMDYFNMMTYDYHGGWSNTAGHNSPLYPYDGEEGGAASLDTTFKYLISKGVSPQKITLGIGSYGRGVITKEAAKLNGTTVKQNMTIQPDGPISTSADYTNWGNFDGSPYYNFIQKNISGWSDNWDDQAKVPYLTKDKFFLSYDNERSIEEKANYVKQNNAGGVIVWTVFGGLKPGNVINVYGSKLPHAPETKDPLINTLNRVFANGSTINTPPIIKGCNNVQILIGSVFDSKKGVTAIDKEDGDISSKIKIEGTVDTQKIGTYTLTYSVVDLGNLTTKVIRTVQVIAAQSPSIDFEKPVNNSTIFINLGDTVPIKLKITDPSSLLTDIKIAVDGKDFSGIIANWIPSKFGTYVITGSANNKDAVIKSQITVIISQKSTSDCNGIPAWDSSKTYSINETQVSYKGNIYKNQWWTSGETPGVAAVWKFVNYCTGGGPDLTETCGYEKWSSDKTYENPGINIYYNEKIYKNQWWTSGETPGINAVWVFVKNCVTPNSSNMQENTSVKIHPNPVNDFITIVTDKNILEVGVYELSSIKVKSFKGNKVIDVHNLKQGYYILKITFNDNSNQSINFYKK